MSIKHTGGTWVVGTEFNNDGSREIPIGVSTPGGFLTVAVAIGGLVDQDSNARLLAASKELLYALRDLDEAYCRAGLPLDKAERHQDRMRLIAARAAIAKATGEHQS